MPPALSDRKTQRGARPKEKKLQNEGRELRDGGRWMIGCEIYAKVDDWLGNLRKC